MTVSADLPARQAESAPLAKRHPVRALAPDGARWTFAFELLLATPQAILSSDAKLVWQALALLSRDVHGVVVVEATYDTIAANAGLVSRGGRPVRRKVAAALRQLKRAGLVTVHQRQRQGRGNVFRLGPLVGLFDLASGGIGGGSAVSPVDTAAVPTGDTAAVSPVRPPLRGLEDTEDHQAPDFEVLRESEPPATAVSPDGFPTSSDDLQPHPDVAELLYAIGVCRGPSDTFAERAPALQAFVAEHGEEACRQALAELPQVEARRRAEGSSALRSPAAWVVARIRKLGAGQDGPQRLGDVLDRIMARQ